MMNYYVAGHTDIGTNRKTNQDAYSIQVAQTPYGKAVFVVLCDGVGGLTCGELASTTVVKAFCDWFENDFKQHLAQSPDHQLILNDWVRLLNMLSNAIKSYSDERGMHTGTTIALLLLIDGKALVANIGDSRVYFISPKAELQQLSEDHTLAHREYTLGRITKEQLASDSRRNILLQCVGAGSTLKLSAASMSYTSECSFLLCTDGFYRFIREDEMMSHFSLGRVQSVQMLKDSLVEMTETVKKRKETDNITSVAVLVQ